ncbi:hypothetical protein EYC84_008422 [Monilinia fructicola]|uniref:Uncharacterized protein n=1 Tax=Monilinia fructicola TaxID=38448 RepID=A0A5M9JF37_MONFR|nr:hypothetical protein EYC84_008422 [Monilinia fructicola]
MANRVSVLCLGNIYPWILLSAFILECLRLRDMGARFLAGHLQQYIFQSHPVNPSGLLDDSKSSTCFK